MVIFSENCLKLELCTFVVHEMLIENMWEPRKTYALQKIEC